MKKFCRLSALSMLVSICLATSLSASAASSASGPSSSSENAPLSRRSELVYEIVFKWGVHVQEAYRANVHHWARELGPLFQNAPLDALQKAANARTFEAMNDALLGKAPSKKAAGLPLGDFETNALGDAAADLVFVPVSPCRLFDTRVAGGIIAAGAARSFDITAVSDYSFQGGSASNCGGAGAAGSFAAAVINFTVVDPSFQGYLTAYPFGTTRPLASTVNYKTGDIVANVSTVALDQGASANELTVYSLAPTHLVGDLVGYFIAPAPTALQCTTVQTSYTLAANGVLNNGSPVCPSGYTGTGGGCFSASYSGRVVSTYPNGATHYCSWANDSATAMNVVAMQTCCRVPGR